MTVLMITGGQSPALGQGTNQSPSIPELHLQRNFQLVQSMQAVNVYAHLNDGADDIDNVKLKVTIDISLEAEESGTIELPSISQITVYLQMIPVAISPGWYVTAIQGLPSQTITVPVNANFPSSMPFGEPVPDASMTDITITSAVNYELTVNGAVKASDSYTVLHGTSEPQDPRPLLYASVYDVVQESSIIDETQGLGPKGWVLSDDKELKILAVSSHQNGGIDELLLEFTVDNSSWQRMPMAADLELMESTNDLVGKTNEILKEIREVLGVDKTKIPDTEPSILIASATIPPQQAGSYVKFRASVTDMEGKELASPQGLYYVSGKSGSNDGRILVIDPHVLLWLHQTNAAQLEQMETQEGDVFKAPSEIADSLAKNNIESFHYWQHLAKDHDIYIAYPKSGLLSELLQKEDWKAIVISNLWLGHKSDSSQTFNWDLQSLGVLDDISDYVRENNAGLIVTHGTLSDWQVWTSCGNSEEERQQVGPRGNVGSSIRDLGIQQETTVAALLGMPQLTVAEFLRDQAAMAVCVNNQAAGRAVGSMPLQIPYVEFDGSFEFTDDAESIGWDTDEIPKNFQIATEAGEKPFTQIGWQLAFPEELGSKAWERLSQDGFSKSSQKISSFADKLALISNSESSFQTNVDSTFLWGLESFHESTSLIYEGDRAAMSELTIDIPPIDETINVPVEDLKIAEENKRRLQLGVKVVALSEDGLGGVVAYDKFWDREGFRSVYFSFEPESFNDELGTELLAQAIEWSQDWDHKPVDLDLSLSEEVILQRLMIPPDYFRSIQPVVQNATWENLSIPVTFTSNSTVSGFEFDQPGKKLKFSVEGPDHTVGISKVAIPKPLLGGNFTVLLDGKQHEFLLLENTTHSFLYFTYGHSIHSVEVLATQAIPEFHEAIAAMTIAGIGVSVVLAVRVGKKKAGDR